MSTISILLDSIVSLLLLICIFYAIIFNKRLKNIQDTRIEFNKLLHDFRDSMGRSQIILRELKKEAESIEKNLSLSMKKAKKMYEELDYIVNRGEKAASQLEKSFQPSTEPSRKKEEKRNDTKDNAILQAIKNLK